MKRHAKVFADVIRKNGLGLAAEVITFVSAGVIFWLYSLPLEPFLYALIFVSFLTLVMLAVSFAKGLSDNEKRGRMIRSVLTEAALPPARTLAEKDYEKAVLILRDELTRLRGEFDATRVDEIDYYTSWVHQIKTPISVMRMELGGMDDDSSRALEAELFRIEQYVDMVLTYIRLGDGVSDLVIKEYPLDTLIRETVRKYAPQFVSKKLRLCYDGTDAVIVTDKKWFCVILEQIVSNAIKYTPSGSITVTVAEDTLTVADTGIGISPEDVARVFEKGFTGENGRIDKRSSGLGLYLCKKAADLLVIPLSVESTVGKGSGFSLGLKDKLVR